ncbi:hypothetical protein [Pseudorhodoplanes sp.]|uniref:hypothetical protein n=1 Tax=Pseudorhodoplanes sp. TaxID=1934341 RepID=UPI003D12F1B4
MRPIALGFLAAVFATTFALGHEANGPNGGRIVDAGDYHVELVAKGGNVEVYVTDTSDKPVATDSLKGLAILTVGGKSQRIELVAAGSNKLQGPATSPIAGNPKGVVQLMLPDGKKARGQYR